MKKAGAKQHLYSFQKRVEGASDALGNALPMWAEQFQQRGRREFMRSGEDVIADRLQGKQKALINVYQSQQMDEVTSDWRMVDTRTQEAYNIRDVMAGERRREITLLVESGVADG